MTDVLKDIRIVEFSDGCSAAFCGRLFARLGADVVMVELAADRQRGTMVATIP